jgi:hypothetical protein
MFLCCASGSLLLAAPDVATAPHPAAAAALPAVPVAAWICTAAAAAPILQVAQRGPGVADKTNDIMHTAAQ